MTSLRTLRLPSSKCSSLSSANSSARLIPITTASINSKLSSSQQRTLKPSSTAMMFYKYSRSLLHTCTTRLKLSASTKLKKSFSPDMQTCWRMTLSTRSPSFSYWSKSIVGTVSSIKAYESEAFESSDTK